MSDTDSSVSGRVTRPQTYQRDRFDYRGRPETPQTEIMENTLPEITVSCKLCDVHIDVRSLKEHRTYHKALELFDYKGTNGPSSLKELLKRRRQIIKKLNKTTDSDNPLPIKTLQKYNDAFELLKAYLEDTYEEFRQIREDVLIDSEGLSLNCSPNCVHAIGICSDGNERWKSTMEDTRVFQDYFGNDGNKCFFGIYDGHHGRFAAEVSANDLHHYLLHEMIKFDPDTSCVCTLNMVEKNDLSEYNLDRPEQRIRKDSIRHVLHEESTNIIQQIMHTCEDNLQKLTGADTDSPVKSGRKKRPKDPFSEKMGQAFRKAYRKTDQILTLGQDEKSRVRWSGCSGLACVIQNTKMTADEQCCEYDTSIAADQENDDVSPDKKSKQVKPPEEKGIIHIANAGNIHGVLCRNGRAYRLTRDHTPNNHNEQMRVLKAGASVAESDKGSRVNGVLDTTRGIGNHGDPHLKKAVICEPYTTSVVIDQYAEFLILANNGVWEVFSEEEAVSLLKDALADAGKPPSTGIRRDLEVLWSRERSQVASTMSPSIYSQYVMDTDLRPLSEKSQRSFTGQEEDLTEAFYMGDGDLSSRRTPSILPSQSRAGILEEIRESPEHRMAPVDRTNKSRVIDDDDDDDDGANEDMEQREGKENSEKIKKEDQNIEEKEAIDRDENNEREEGLNGEGERSSSKNQNATEQLEEGTGGDSKQLVEFDETSMISRSASLFSGGSSRYSRESEPLADDLQTEVGSQVSFGSRDVDEDDDGHEADVDTVTEIHSVYMQSRMSEPPSKQEMYCQYAKVMSEKLVHAALLAGSKDNITVMVILLPGSKLKF